MEPRPNVIPVENETTSTATRITADGRTITYSLKVLQQPARARACGQGAKSSADRRPVDPPPIVELTIFQGEKREEDITFVMNANYFLFATLEQARPIAQGRVSQERNTPPVLTGTPVAGMVYLDRPKPAGYFIFPDLSVRHEGRYRLSFNLYEELKNPKDDDPTSEPLSSASPGDHHATHRLDVRSEPFHVYSAKKFPGLMESTSLSRMVAEQGCRVRIRRDVRMRRREPKGGSKEWDEYEEDTAAARARQQSATPEPSMYAMAQTPQGYMEQVPRPRSSSNASHHSVGSVFSRRPSLQDLAQTYHQPQYAAPPPPMAASESYPQTGPYAPGPPPPQYQPNGFMQQQQHQAPMQPPPQQCQPHSFPAPPPSLPCPAPSAYYGNSSAPPPQAAQPQPQYVQPHAYENPSQPPRLAMDYPSQPSQDMRRGSLQHIPPPPPPQGGYAHQPTDPFSNSRPTAYEILHPPARAAGAHTPMSVKPSYGLPPINTSMMSGPKLEASSPASSAPPQSSYFSSTQTPQDPHKRSYGNVFSDRHQNGPLRQGARPTSFGQVNTLATSGALLSAADDDDNDSVDFDPDTFGMHYRRADGRQILRPLPEHI